MKRLLFILVLVAAAVGCYYAYERHGARDANERELALFGTVDLRQAELAFKDNERVTQVLVQEGDRVEKGQVLARLDTTRLEAQIAQQKALVAAQREVVERLHSGSRPEEIAQARANVESAKADAANSKRQYERLKELSRGAVSVQDFENAKAALDVANARLVVNEKALDLSVAGPRKEEIAEAEARLLASQAQLAYLEQQLADAELRAPANGVIRSRVLEPGEMASPQRPALLLAITDPKWVRAYVPEPELGRLGHAQRARVTVDSFPGRVFEGWVGFVSPVAEFTPKTVQVEELRTSLVYEVRVFVKDPKDELRLGMPASVHLDLDAAAPVSSSVDLKR